MRIDTHSHLFPRWYLDNFAHQSGHASLQGEAGHRYIDFGVWRKPEMEAMYDVERKLGAMDAAGIDLAVLSLDLPGVELLEANGPAVARRVNEWLAGLCRRYPDRFVALASLPLRHVPDAVAEMEYCWQQLGLRGGLLFSNIAGASLDDPKFDPFFAYAASEGIPLYLHPTHPLTARQVARSELIRGVGFVIDTSLAVLRLIFAGTFTRYPNLTLIMPHCGGFLPTLIERVDFMSAPPGSTAPPDVVPSQFVHRLTIDTVANGPAALAAALGRWDAANVLFGSDHPYQTIGPQVELLESSLLDDHAKHQVFAENARRIFRIAER